MLSNCLTPSVPSTITSASSVIWEGPSSELTPTRTGQAYVGNIRGREIVYERSREQVQADIDKAQAAGKEFRR